MTRDENPIRYRLLNQGVIARIRHLEKDYQIDIEEVNGLTEWIVLWRHSGSVYDAEKLKQKAINRARRSFPGDDRFGVIIIRDEQTKVASAIAAYVDQHERTTR